MAAVIQLNGKENIQILIADYKINVLLSYFVEIFHVLPAVCHSQQVLYPYLGADNIMVLICRLL